MTKPRCPHDGGTCHHDCKEGECFRERHGVGHAGPPDYALKNSWQKCRFFDPFSLREIDDRACTGKSDSKCQTLELEKSYVYWGTGNEDTLHYHDFDEAVEAHLDGFLGPRETKIQLPDELTLIEYEPVRICKSKKQRLAESVCTLILNELDEDYADPSEDLTTPDELEREMAQQLVEQFASNYRVWACERTSRTRTIEVARWILKNRPDWLEGDLEADEAFRQWVQERTEEHDT